MTNPEHMKNDPLPNCPELLIDRDEIVLRLGIASVNLCNANSEYNSTIIELIKINKLIEEVTNGTT